MQRYCGVGAGRGEETKSLNFKERDSVFLLVATTQQHEVASQSPVRQFHFHRLWPYAAAEDWKSFILRERERLREGLFYFRKC